MPEFRDVIPGSQVSVSQPSLAGLQAALAAGTLSSAALTGFYLQRIERLNPALHAVITVNTDAPACPDCGAITVRSGSCYKCLNCGATTGCS